MKQYPDYKYRPRRRKGSKKANGNSNSSLQTDHTSSSILYDRSSSCSPHYSSRFPRSNSFSYSDYPNRQSDKDFQRLSSSVPAGGTRLSVSPESIPPSSPEEAIHDNISYSSQCLNHYQASGMNTYEQSHQFSGSHEFPKTSINTMISHIPVPQCQNIDIKVDQNDNYWKSINNPMVKPGMYQDKRPRMTQDFTCGNNYAGNVKSQFYDQSGVFDVSDIKPEDMEIYINPNNHCLDVNRNAIDSCLRIPTISARTEMGSVKCVPVKLENDSMYSENDYNNDSSEVYGEVSPMRQDSEQCRDIPSVCYDFEFDAQPMINAITHKSG